jgi:hypothetical protein
MLLGKDLERILPEGGASKNQSRVAMDTQLPSTARTAEVQLGARNEPSRASQCHLPCQGSGKNRTHSITSPRTCQAKRQRGRSHRSFRSDTLNSVPQVTLEIPFLRTKKLSRLG